MENDLLISLTKSYADILPQNKESLLLIVWLYQKIEKGIIAEDFEQKDLDDTIDDIIDFLKIESEKNKEVLFKKISSHFFITERIGNKYQIHLTVFAKEFCKLLIQEVQPEIIKLELYHVFKRTLPLLDDDLINITTFSYWFKNHFKPSRNEIYSQTEKLNRDVADRINELSNLLKIDVQNPKEQIGSYAEIFVALEKQTTSLINTIDYKNETLNKIKNAKEKFAIKEEIFDEFTLMQNEVENFFQNIDRRIISINDKIQLASKRLRNLLDTLKHKQLFKIKIEKLLLLLLKSSKYEKGSINLHEKFPRKYLPFIPLKFLAIPKIDFQFYAKAEQQKQEYDKQYEESERKKGIALLEIQEATAKWLDEINCELELGNKIEYEQWFDKIVDHEKNLEVPIQVCYGLIEKHSNFISIEKEEILKNKDDLMLWKMQIKASHS
ncbi:MAG: hypothetical protein WCL06_04160 [Bacteroidota bacterium]